MILWPVISMEHGSLGCRAERTSTRVARPSTAQQESSSNEDDCEEGPETVVG
jgi:hypothetical protein